METTDAGAEIKVESKRVLLTVKVVEKIGDVYKPLKGHEAEFHFHDRAGTGYIDMGDSGIASFELWSFRFTGYVVIRSKLNATVATPHHVKFYQTSYKLDKLEDDLTLVFVLVR